MYPNPSTSVDIVGEPLSVALMSMSDALLSSASHEGAQTSPTTTILNVSCTSFSTWTSSIELVPNDSSHIEFYPWRANTIQALFGYEVALQTVDNDCILLNIKICYRDFFLRMLWEDYIIVAWHAWSTYTCSRHCWTPILLLVCLVGYYKSIPSMSVS